MKALVLAAALAAALATPALAADAVPPPAQAAPKFSADTPIGDLMADPRAKAVLDARAPGIDRHPMYDMVKTMSLRQIQPYSEGKITEEMLTELDKELAAIK
jgi:opacity protein-like surface antigen